MVAKPEWQCLALLCTTMGPHSGHRSRPDALLQMMPSSCTSLAAHPLSKQVREAIASRFGFTQTGLLIRRKPHGGRRAHLDAYRSRRPAARTEAVETTQRIPVASGSPARRAQQPASRHARPLRHARPRRFISKKSGHRAGLSPLSIVLVAIIIALVIFFAIRPFDNAATQTTAEGSRARRPKAAP